MTYIELINNFWSSHEIHSYRPNDIALYFYLLKVYNVIGRNGAFKRNRYELMVFLSIKDRRTLQSSFDKLEQGGLLFTKAKPNNPNLEILFPQTCAKNAQVDAQVNAQDYAQDYARVDAHINKSKSNKKDISKDISKKDNENENQFIDNPHEKKQKASSAVFITPSVEEVNDYCSERNNNIDAQAFVDYYTAKGWLVGRTKMKDWRAAVRTWENNNSKYQNNGKNSKNQSKYQSFAQQQRSATDEALGDIVEDFRNRNCQSL